MAQVKPRLQEQLLPSHPILHRSQPPDLRSTLQARPSLPKCTAGSPRTAPGPHGVSRALPGTKGSRTTEEDPSFLGGHPTPSSHTPLPPPAGSAWRQLLFDVSPTPSSCPIKAPSPLEGPFSPSLFTKAPYGSPPPPQTPALPCHPCPVLAANLTVPISLPVSHCSHTRHTLTTALLVGGPCGPQKGQAGIRGSAPPRKVGVPSSGRAHMSLAGRFFPSTMRMNSELRLAIVGPRRGVLARGSRTPGSRAAAGGGLAGAGLGAGGAGPAGPGR